MNFLGNTMGKICKILLPIPEEIYLGNPNSSIAICTLSSIKLLKNIHHSKIMQDVFLVGRLLSENKGIDTLIQNVIHNSKISIIIICGKEVWGHKAGHSLIALYNNGVFHDDGRIINSHSPDPILSTTIENIKHFQQQVTIIDKIGEEDPDEIIKLVQSLL